MKSCRTMFTQKDCRLKQPLAAERRLRCEPPKQRIPPAILPVQNMPGTRGARAAYFGDASRPSGSSAVHGSDVASSFNCQLPFCCRFGRATVMDSVVRTFLDPVVLKGGV